CPQGGPAPSGRLLLMIFIVDVDVPKRLLVGAAGGDVVDRSAGGEHRVVLIVVAMHAVAADEKQVLDRIHPGADDCKLGVGAEVCRVGSGHPSDGGGDDFLPLDQVDLFQFSDRQILQFTVGALPQVVLGA